jgi:hypothetical protein
MKRRLHRGAIAFVLLPFVVLSCTTNSANMASDPAAKTTAESFVRAWLSDDWESALTYVAESGPSRESLSDDNEFFRRHDFRIVGPARFTESIDTIGVPGYVVPLTGFQHVPPAGENGIRLTWLLEIALEANDDAWAVTGYVYTAGPPVGTD